jgi:integrase
MGTAQGNTADQLGEQGPMASVHPRVNKATGAVAWQVRWREHGRQQSATFPNEHAARLAAQRIDVLGHLPDDLRLGLPHRPDTLAAAIDAHLDQLVGVQDNTLADYRRIADAHLAPLAPLLLADLDRTVLARWVSTMRDNGLSPKTIRNVHGLLSAVMATAMRDRRIEHNPCVGMRLPRSDPSELRFLTPDEYGKVREHLTEPYLTLADFLAGTGCRFGEATALAVRDITGGTARISKAWKRQPDGEWTVGVPKTRRSRRTVWLPPELVAILEPRLSRPRDALLFTSRRGERISQQTFGANWRRAVKASGIAPPAPRVHDLRHSHVAWLIAQGIDLATIQDRLGHESITTTIDRYGHLVPDLRVKAADAAGAVWRQPKALPR